MTKAEGAQRSSGGRILLFASLAINLFLLGLLVGGWSQGMRVLRPDLMQPVVGAPMAGDIMNVRRLAQTLPPDMRTKLQDAMRAGAPDFRQARRDAMNARRGIYEALKADPFERDQLESAFADVRVADERLRQVSQNIFFEFASQLDDEERATLVKGLEDVVRDRSMRNRGPNRGRNGGRPGRFRDGNRPPGQPDDIAPDRPPPDEP